MIKFLLNDESRTVEKLSTNTTVLEYLRLHANKPGTKEGCASGDCGACTVVVAEVVDDELSFTSLNSCIALVGTLHGKQLITVEDLSEKQLHPAQQAMVDCHGSQCGFCTPGFVMSLFSLYQDKQNFSKQDAEHYLAGNLCRCTGYQPILNAAERLNGSERNDKFIRNSEQTKRKLKALNNDSEINTFSHNGSDFYQPQTTEQLSQLLAQHEDASLCAGSTDLALEITQQHKHLSSLIYTGAVRELQQLKVSDTHIEIGAAVTYEQAMPVVQEYFPALVEMILRLGSKQIRNVATFGGNIGNASPIGDMPPCFIALDAQLVLEAQGSRRSIPIEEYFIDYKKTCLRKGEYISMIRVPKLQTEQLCKVYKISKRIDDDISAVAAAFCISFSQDGDLKIMLQCKLWKVTLLR